MSIVLRIVSFADGKQCLSSGEFVRDYDPDAHDGLGQVLTTADPADAVQFPNADLAFAYWRQVSKVRPKRLDGEPNRPLTAFNVELLKVEGPQSCPRNGETRPGVH